MTPGDALAHELASSSVPGPRRRFNNGRGYSGI